MKEKMKKMCIRDRRSAVHTEYAVDIANASKADNANAWLYYYNGSEPQDVYKRQCGDCPGNFLSCSKTGFQISWRRRRRMIRKQNIFCLL